MHLTVNGTRKTYERPLTVGELLELEKVAMREYVSVQLNETFVKREDFSRTRLKDNDAVDFLYYMGGGNR